MKTIIFITLLLFAGVLQAQDRIYPVHPSGTELLAGQVKTIGTSLDSITFTGKSAAFMVDFSSGASTDTLYFSSSNSPKTATKTIIVVGGKTFHELLYFNSKIYCIASGSNKKFIYAVR